MTAAMAPMVLGDRLTGPGSETPPYLAIYASVPPYWVAGASVLGQRHAHYGRPRDDALAVRTGRGRLVVVAADGVGAAPLARYGAACVGTALATALARHSQGAGPRPGVPGSPAARRWRSRLLRLARRHAAPGLPAPAFEAPGAGSGAGGTLAWWPAEATPLPPEPDAPPADLAVAVRTAYGEARAALCARASELGCDPGDLATTGLLVAVQGSLVAAGQLGDGALLGLTRAGSLHLLVPLPQQPDPRWTAALSDEHWEAHLEVHVWDRPGDPFALLLVATDGVANDLLRAGLPAARDWSASLAATLQAAAGPEQAAARLATWLAAYRAAGSWDDRTLVAIVRQEAPRGGDD